MQEAVALKKLLPLSGYIDYDMNRLSVFIFSVVIFMLWGTETSARTVRGKVTCGQQNLSDLTSTMDLEADIITLRDILKNSLPGRNPDLILRGGEFLNLLKGRKVHIIYGHNHINMNFQYAPDVMEHNVAWEGMDRRD